MDRVIVVTLTDRANSEPDPFYVVGVTRELNKVAQLIRNDADTFEPPVELPADLDALIVHPTMTIKSECGDYIWHIESTPVV